ncbi:type VI secretion system tip protein TssI/VgrG [Pseudomonas purpurea]|uniref:type VI secretion system Vgr family protein n=1 Tax=Pseudomonas purpurea TaxID=3136737 RepID=UPI00326322A8
MHNDMESPFTLTLAAQGLSLPVQRFSGREAFNEPYCFEITLSRRAPLIDLNTLLGQPAFLDMDTRCGIHGIVQSAGLQYRDPQTVGYQLTLAPSLMVLAQGPVRRVFHELSVPAILRQLLEAHRLPDTAYRFELPGGHYPPRPFCIQYDESDLHLLHRLCEEEGIHYYFEHQPDAHVLVFAEDADSFAQQPVMARFRPPPALTGRTPAITHVYQRHYLPAPTPLPASPPSRSESSAMETFDGAANQPPADTQPAMGRQSPALARRQQLSRRALERLRSRHQQIEGQGTHPHLRSGHLVQLSEHPLSMFNDQWLVTEVQHLGLAPSETATQEEQWLADDPTMHPQGYGNRFKAIPWSVVFRPALNHPKPCIPGYQRATVCGPKGQLAALDEQGRIKISLWSTQAPDSQAPAGFWLPMAPGGQTRQPLCGSEVLIGFVDNDPDQPVLLAFPEHPVTAPAPAPGVYLDGCRLSDATAHVHVGAGQRLHVEDVQPLTLTARRNQLHLSPERITLCASAETTPASRPREMPKPDARLADGDLYLFAQPPARTERLADTTWYIVRLPHPGFKNLPGLGRDCVLMEGKSQASGNLGLSAEQTRHLAEAFVSTPQQLCLLYPGHCVPLAEYFDRHWNPEQRAAFLQQGKPPAAAGKKHNSDLLLDWLLNRPAPSH